MNAVASFTWQARFTRQVTRALNGVLRPLGWWTHGSDDSFRRWFHREVDETRKEQGNRKAVGERPKNRLQCVTFEASWFKPQWGLAWEFKMEHDAESTFQWFVSLPFIMALWVTMDIGYLDWIARKVGQYGKASFGFSITPTVVTGSWFVNDMDSSGNPGKSKHFYWPWESLKGRAVFTKIDLEREVVSFEQPAWKDRPSTVHAMVMTRQLCRWHWPNPLCRDMVRTYWDLDLEKPPAFSGKGENGWDCGENGINGCACDGTLSQAEAIAWYIREVEKNRARYG